MKLFAALTASLFALVLAAPAQAVFIQEYRQGIGQGVNSENRLLGITLADGNLWVANFAFDSLTRVTPAGQATEFPLGAGSRPRDVTVGPDGNLWVSLSGAAGFKIFTTAGQQVRDCTGLQNPANASMTLTLNQAARVGDRVWFSTDELPGLVSYDATSCANREYLSAPGGIQDLLGVGGVLWYSSISSQSVHSVTPPTGPVTDYPMGASPKGLAMGSDGRIWVALGSNQVAAITPSPSSITKYPDAPSPDLADPEGLAGGPDGNIWVASRGNSRIARVTPAGQINTFLAPSDPRWITGGPDGDLWATLHAGYSVARILVDQPPRAVTGPGSASSATTAVVGGQVDSRGASTTVVVEYGPTTAYGSSAAAGTVPAGIGAENVTATLTGLTGNTTYHFRLRATNAFGSTTGADGTFTTPRGTSGVDLDGDGISPPADCNDNNPKIRPGVRDIPANRIDENCDGKDAKRRRISATLSATYQLFSDHTRFLQMALKTVPSNTTAKIRCRGRGCPKSKTLRFRKAKRRVSLTKYVRGRRLRPGAVLEVTITKRGTIGKVFRFSIRSGKLPRKRELCLTPGARRPTRC